MKIGLPAQREEAMETMYRCCAELDVHKETVEAHVRLTRPLLEERKRLIQIPGIEQRAAEVLLAEIGPDMQPFPSPKHLSKWAGRCPGNNDSAGCGEEKERTDIA